MLIVHLFEVLHNSFSSNMLAVDTLLVTTSKALSNQVFLAFFGETKLWVLAGLAKDKLVDVSKFKYKLEICLFERVFSGKRKFVYCLLTCQGDDRDPGRCGYL